jgi:hypothetical protein
VQGSANDHVPGWAPSPCRLPGPVSRGTVRTSARFFTRQCTATQAPPSERQKRCATGVRGEVCGRVLGASSWGLSFLVLSSWVCLVLSWVLSSFLWVLGVRSVTVRRAPGKRCAGQRQRAWCAGEFLRRYWGEFLGSLILTLVLLVLGCAWFLGVPSSFLGS